MVQIFHIPAPERQGTSEFIGKSFGEGVASGMDTSMQYKMKQMFDQQEQTRSGNGLADFLVNNKMLDADHREEMAKSLGVLPKELQGTVVKQLLQYKDLGTMNQALSELRSGVQPTNGQSSYGSSAEFKTTPSVGPNTLNQGIGQKRSSLPPGKDFMLPYEEIPDKEQIEQPSPINVPKKATPEKKMSPKQIYNQRKANLEKTYNEYLPKFSPDGQKQWRGFYQDSLKSLQQDRANDIAEQKMEQGDKSLKLKEKTEATKKTVEEEQKFIQKFINDSSATANKLPREQNLLKIAKSSIDQHKFGLLSLDNIADMTGIQGFRTPEGESFRSAIKEYFLDDISRVGCRPNMFIEQMLANILPTVGKNYKANMAWVEVQQMKMDLDRHQYETIQKLTPQYLDEYGKPTRGLVDAVNNEMLKYGDRLQEKIAYKLQKNMEDDATIDDLRSMKPVTTGTPLTAKRASELLKMAKGKVEDANLVAKELGYKIIDRNLLDD